MLNKKSILILVLILFFSLIFCIPSLAKDLDSINEYYITINTRTDASLDIRYDIAWKVLDSTTQGPLDWVKIGIPNSNVDNIKDLSSNIKSISHLNNGGDYVRIYFDREYHAGEIIKFSFSIHQSYMFTIKDDICNFRFIPGWFEEISIEDIQIKWNSKNVLNASTNEKTQDGYYLWRNSLRKGERLKIEVNYKTSAFSKLDETKSAFNAKKNDNSKSESITIIIVMIIISVGVLYLIIYPSSYSSSRCLGYGRHYHNDYHDSSLGVSSFCVSSCACACACAGGGRAGCSKKDFYGTNLKVSDIKNVLKKDE